MHIHRSKKRELEKQNPKDKGELEAPEEAMDPPFEHPSQSNREHHHSNRYVSINSHDHQHHHPHPRQQRPIPHPQGPFISPPSSPYHPSHPPINLPLPPDARRPLRSPIVQHPPNRIPANHLIPFPIPHDRAHIPDVALTAPRLLWDEAPRLVRRRSPIPIGWEGHGPLFPEPDPRRHHQGLPLEIINSDHVSRKRYNPDTNRYESVRDDRSCGEIPWNESDHPHHLHQHQDQRHDHRHIRRRNNPPLESFSPDSFPSTSAAAAPDHRSIEWTARNRIPFDATDPPHCIATERAERVRRPFDAPGHLDAGSAERAARVRYPPDGPIAPDLSSSEKDAHGRHPYNGPKPLNHSPGEKGAWVRHPHDGLNLLDHSPGEKAIRNRLSLDASYPFDHSLGEKATRIGQPFDGPKHNDPTPGEKVARLKYPLNGPKPQDHSPFERTARTRYPCDGTKSSNPISFERDGRIRYPSHGTRPPNLSSVDREKQIIQPFDGPKLPDHGFAGRNPRNRYLLDAPKLLQQRIERGNYTEEDQLWIEQTPQETDKKVINGNDDVLRTVSGKRLPLHARLGNGKKMVVHEKSQKPSALLRIQSGSKPFRKRRDELLLSSAYAASSSMADLKGKVPLSSSEHVSEKDSSVELDVSFKSNALVAKPILPTPSQTVNNTNKVPVKKKKKTVNVVKRVVSKTLSRLAGKKIGKSSVLSSCRNDLQHSEIVEEGPPWSMAVGNGGADAQSSSPQKEMQKIEVLEEVKPSNAEATAHADLDPRPSPVVVLIDDSSAEESPEVAALLEEESKNSHAMHEDNEMKCMHPNLGSTSFVKDLIIVDSRSPSPSGFEVDLQDALPAGVSTEILVGALKGGVKEKEKEREDQKEVSLLVECGTTGNGDCEDTEEVSSMGKESGILPLEVQTLVFDQRSPSEAIYVDGSNLMCGVELHQSDCKQPGEDVFAGSTLDSNEDGAAHSLDRVSVMHSLEPLPVVPEGIFLNAVQSLCQPSDENSCMDNKNRLDEKASSEDGLPLEAHDASILEPEVDKELDKSNQINDQLVHEKPPPLPLQGTTKPTADPSLIASEFIGKRTHQRSGIPRSFRHSTGFASGSLKGKTSSASILRPRTWRRSDGSPSPIREFSSSHSALRRVSPRKSGKAQNMSYIRKGNSLVRNAAAVTSLSEASADSNNPVNVSNTSGGDKITSCFGSDRKVESTSYSKTGGTNPSIVRPQTPPLPHTAKLPNCNINHTHESPCLTMTEPLSQAGSETSMHESLDPNKPEQGKDASGSVKGFENQAINLPLDGVENQCAVGVGTSRSSKTKRLIYVKRKSNQLVAASRPETHDSSLSATKIPEVFPFSTSSDFYYKKKRNQLVRNSALLKHQSKQAVAIFDDNSNSEGQGAAKISSLKFDEGLIKGRFDKVLKKTCKPSRLSLVWTLGGTQSHKRDVTSLQRPKVLPYLVPWKRTMYWRCFINNIMPTSNKSSSSLIRKLRLLRKRDTVYTRSISGFSLRKSRVLSVGGTNLKWSKSIERRSKKANEEVTLAVAAVEKEKREQKGAELIVRNGKNGSRSSRKSFHGIESLPGERIFRIGSIRYKMDSSKRTLLRIPDEKSSCSVDLKSGKNSTISFVPRRLVIGNDEYIRIGNGNQLVRDPKRLTRILASEKVRWSLHTARLRLARKKQYCQFFTRFGKCNKDSGKCQYIHDPAKVAVCTKFLKGSCSDTNCRLTHKIIPERMQDCSYFLQGLCTNESCPYRHVNVNPDASVCDGFLRGYCADSNECRRKHSYNCPMFEATGMCPQGSACKLHHPKSRNKSRKRKRPKNQTNGRGRYFLFPGLTDAGHFGTVTPDDGIAPQCGDIFFCDGQYADYISLDAGDEEASKIDNPIGTNTSLCGGESSGIWSENLDALIKPVRLMNMNAS